MDSDELEMFLFFDTGEELDSMAVGENSQKVALLSLRYIINSPIEWWVEVSDDTNTVLSEKNLLFQKILFMMVQSGM